MFIIYIWHIMAECFTSTFAIRTFFLKKGSKYINIFSIFSMTLVSPVATLLCYLELKKRNCLVSGVALGFWCYLYTRLWRCSNMAVSSLQAMYRTCIVSWPGREAGNSASNSLMTDDFQRINQQIGQIKWDKSRSAGSGPAAHATKLRLKHVQNPVALVICWAKLAFHCK